MKKVKKETPSVSIDEALKLYLSAAVPGGLPQDIDPDLLLKRLKTFIAKDKPEWSKKFENESTVSPQELKKSYSKIKQEIVEKALKEEIPQDPEERYLYDRRKEALANRLEKKEEEKIDQIQDALIKKVLNKKKAENLEKEKDVDRIKEALKKKVMEALKTKGIDPSKFSLQKQTLNISKNELSSGNLSLETSNKLSSQFAPDKIENWNNLKWNPSQSLINKQVFKNMDLTENQKDKLVALDTFHEMRRQNMSKRSDVIKPLTFEPVNRKKAEKKEASDDKVAFSKQKEKDLFSMDAKQKVDDSLNFEETKKVKGKDKQVSFCEQNGDSVKQERLFTKSTFSHPEKNNNIMSVDAAVQDDRKRVKRIVENKMDEMNMGISLSFSVNNNSSRLTVG